jgi:hypothetical protein
MIRRFYKLRYYPASELYYLTTAKGIHFPLGIVIMGKEESLGEDRIRQNLVDKMKEHVAKHGPIEERIFNSQGKLLN